VPRYFFHVHGDRFDAPDLAGKDCANLECAQKIAHRIAGELVMNSLLGGQVPMEVTIEVEDEDLRPVLSLPLHETLIEIMPESDLLRVLPPDPDPPAHPAPHIEPESRSSG
jgi:hypothetical protein